MTEIKGIVAGIGNKEANKNVITPQFDASVVDFMVGGSAIVEGLQLINKGSNVRTIGGKTQNTPYLITGGGGAVYYSTDYIITNIGKNATNIKLEQTVAGVTNTVSYNTNTGLATCTIASNNPNSQVVAELSWETPVAPRVTKGMVVHKGYRGELLEDIENLAETKVYATFILHNDPEVTDEFKVITTNDDETLPEEDVKGNTITYNLLLYSGGVRNPDLYDIPAIAERSLTCNTVLEGGVIDSNVIGTTQDPNDNSLRIATTKYVENQIAHDIAYDTTTIDAHWVDDWTDNIGSQIHVASFTLQKKAKQVLINITLKDGIRTQQDPNATASSYLAVEKIPTEYRPKVQKSIVSLIRYTKDTVNKYDLWNIIFERDGAISFCRHGYELSLSPYVPNMPAVPLTITFGWETL